MTSQKKITTIPIKRFVLCFLIIISLCLTLTPCSAYNLAEKVKEFTLDNGLKVLIVERHAGPTVSLYISHPTGGANDESGHTGTAHFLEHMRFKGTETIGTVNYREEKVVLEKILETGSAIDSEEAKGKNADQEKLNELRNLMEALQSQAKKFSIQGEIDRLYTKNGGADLNAFTGQDMTTYHVSLPTNKIELWARIESDRLANPVFRDFYSERNVVMEERKQRVESDPDGKLREQFMATAFVAHPYRRPILGWTSDMRFLSPEYTLQFFKNHYTPNNTIITIVGDVNPEDVMKTVRLYFGKLPGRTENLMNITEEPLQIGERRVQVRFDASPMLIIGYHKPTLPSFDDCVFDVIDTILSGGRTSRFFKILVEEKGLASNVTTANGYPGARYPNLFVVFADPIRPHTTEELENAIYEELERLKTDPVDIKELEKAKNQLKADLLRNISTNSGLASMLSYYETVTGDWRYINNFMDMLQKVTPEDIMAAAEKYLSRDNRTVATLVGEK